MFEFQEVEVETVKEHRQKKSHFNSKSYVLLIDDIDITFFAKHSVSIPGYKMKTLNYASYTQLVRMVKILRVPSSRGSGLTTLLQKLIRRKTFSI